ncbi:MAG: hypothetical protein Q7K21_06970 [Elusimicrobiota bacterium]|nr:hypothetical protein [Elusimicrobiota bacterium]
MKIKTLFFPTLFFPTLKRRLLSTFYLLLPDFKGSALVFVMVALLFLAGVGLTFVFWLSSESRQAGRRQAVTRDYYVAEAGTESMLRDVKSGTYLWTKGFSYTSSYILNGESVTVTVTNVGE